MSKPHPARREEPGDLVELLLDCHERIRRFAGLAQKLARAKGSPDHEVRDVALAVRRYFDEALPLHVADEEETVLPRLKARAPELAPALERMVDEHREHQHDLALLVMLCSDIADEPKALDEKRAELAELAQRLGDDFERHLAVEERELFPAIDARLPVDERKRMLAELRARRSDRDSTRAHAR
ncbi:MAG: hemerythrin domain-containing protein [Planctomycetes bacterium]|nr:hemerythrin domain-containing protein [Planctomycetota bacterium]